MKIVFITYPEEVTIATTEWLSTLTSPLDEALKKHKHCHYLSFSSRSKKLQTYHKIFKIVYKNVPHLKDIAIHTLVVDVHFLCFS